MEQYNGWNITIEGSGNCLTAVFTPDIFALINAIDVMKKKEMQKLFYDSLVSGSREDIEKKYNALLQRYLNKLKTIKIRETFHVSGGFFSNASKRQLEAINNAKSYVDSHLGNGLVYLEKH